MSLKSILEDQTLLPDEVVLVVDGPVGALLDAELHSATARYGGKLKLLRQERNMGLGHALNIGLLYCSHELVARMDTDDIAAAERFRTQIDFLDAHPEVAVLGANIEEFNQVPGDLGCCRKLPEKAAELYEYGKFRSPVNHPVIVFRKSAVLDAGSYNGDLRLFEDFSLFIRMLHKGYHFHNLQQVLLHFRVGDGTASIKRRSGLNYARNELKLGLFAHRIGYLNVFQLIRFVLLRVPLRLLPADIILFVYSKFLRPKRT